MQHFSINSGDLAIHLTVVKDELDDLGVIRTLPLQLVG